MTQSLKVYLITQVSLRIAIDISFLILYVLRIIKLDRMASNNFQPKSKALRAKVFSLLLFEVLLVLHMFLGYFYRDYWIHQYQNFSLVDIVEIVNCLLQIYILRKENKKRAIKALAVPALWVFWLLINLITVIFVLIVVPNTAIILFIFKVVVLLFMIIIGCFFDQKSIASAEVIAAVNSPLIPETRRTSEAYSLKSATQYEQNKLYVEFNKQFNVYMKGGRFQCEFKLAVFVGHESNILTKKEEDFVHLAEEMSKTFPLCDEVKLKQKNNEPIINMKKYGEQKQKLFQTYLVQLTKNEKFYTTFLLDFLQVSSLNRIGLSKRRQKNLFSKKDSMGNDDGQPFKKPFFNVQLVNGRIHVSNPQILQIILNKSKNQIQKFHNRLISEKKLKMELLSEQPQISEIIHFIFRIVNSKELWRCFAEWLVLGKQLEEKIYNIFDFWNHGFSNIAVNIIGYQIAFDQQGSIHNLYLLSVSQKEQIESDEQKLPILREKVTLKKRFNDFVRLNKNVKKFITQHNIKVNSVISLPPKFSPFGTKTSPKSRQIYLDNYLNELLKIQRINHCVKFLQFLQIDIGRLKQDFTTVDEENLGGQRISSLIIDDLENTD